MNHKDYAKKNNIDLTKEDREFEDFEKTASDTVKLKNPIYNTLSSETLNVEGYELNNTNK